MKRRQHQQMVESDHAPYREARSQPRHEVSSVRFSLVVGIIILGLLVIGGAILGILSLADVIRGHPGESWRHFLSWWEAIRWWLLAGGIALIALHIQKERSHTVIERAEADVKRAEAKRIRRETEML